MKNLLHHPVLSDNIKGTIKVKTKNQLTNIVLTDFEIQERCFS